jgi:hypothetical protein
MYHEVGAAWVEKAAENRIASTLLLGALGLALLLGVAATGVNSLADVSFRVQSTQVSLALCPFGSHACFERSGETKCVGIDDIESQDVCNFQCLVAIKLTAAFEVISLSTLLATILLAANVRAAKGKLFCCTAVMYVLDVLFTSITATLALTTPPGPFLLDLLRSVSRSQIDQTSQKLLNCIMDDWISWTFGRTAVLWAGSAAVTLSISIGIFSWTCCCERMTTKKTSSASSVHCERSFWS